MERGKMVDRCTSSLYSRTSSSNSTKYPSFSSTLLDSIYRSFDLGEEEMAIYNYRDVVAKKKMKKDCNSVSVDSGGADAKVRGVLFRSEEEMANFERACMIEKWMEKKAAGEKMAVRRKSMAVVDQQMKKSRKDDRENSSFSSSDSSCGGGGLYFSSSEPESLSLRRPQTIHEKGKTAKNHRDFEINCRERPFFADQSEQKPKNDSGFLKTKSRALKIYGDLKKVKQPISPGGKLATFLNSLFTAGNSKKHKTAANPYNSPALSKSVNTSTCSSASSFSRSCLSKTPTSSRGKPSNIAKRSVKFVSIIADEHSDQSCGHKSSHQENRIKNEKQNSDDQTSNSNNGINSIRAAIDEQLMVHIMAKNRRVEEAAMDLLRKTHFQNQPFDQDFDEEDDAESYASSDLFELDNLSAIGMEELPVYETTFLGTKRDNTIKGLIT